MKHLSDSTLALYAGRDLGLLARWRAERHLAVCETCRQEVEEYTDLREALPELAEMPDLHWNRMAAEMKANIRLGLAAGECVKDARPASRERTSLFGPRALISYASITALLVASVLLERPAPKMPLPDETAVVLRATPGAIEWNGGGRGLSLLHQPGSDVTVLVDARGSVRAGYVDEETGYVTINKVYAQ